MARAPSAKAAASSAPAAGSNFPILKDKAVAEAVEAYCKARDEYNAAEAVMEAQKPIIFAAMGDAPTAYCGNRVLTQTTVPALPATQNVSITKDMIGQVIPGKRGRKGYSQLRVQ